MECAECGDTIHRVDNYRKEGFLFFCNNECYNLYTVDREYGVFWPLQESEGMYFPDELEENFRP